MRHKESGRGKKYNVVPFTREPEFYMNKGFYYYQKNLPEKALMFFNKAAEIEPENTYNQYNLACLLSRMGKLREANRIFHYIVEKLDRNFADCYFLLAINYGLLDDIEKSGKYLRMYLDTDPDGDMFFEALELLEALEEDPGEFHLPAYNKYDRVMDLLLKKGNFSELEGMHKKDAAFRAALRDRLYHVSDQFKEEIVRFYGNLGNDLASSVLRDFVRNPWIKERFRQLALLELKKISKERHVRVFCDGTITEVDLEEQLPAVPVWQDKWQQVLDLAMENMRRSNCYEDGFFEDVKAIWLDYINTVYPNVPRIKKPQTWAAALEYTLVRFHYLNLTQKELAMEYGVSPASLSGRFKEINRVLQIDRKAYQNMLAYLRGEE